MTEKQLDELFSEMTVNTNSRVRKKMLWWFTLEKSYRREEVAEIARIDEKHGDKLHEEVRRSTLQCLLKEDYHQPKSQL